MRYRSLVSEMPPEPSAARLVFDFEGKLSDANLIHEQHVLT